MNKIADMTNEELVAEVRIVHGGRYMTELVRRFEDLLDDDRYENADHHKLVQAGLESPSPLTVALAKRLDEALTLLKQGLEAADYAPDHAPDAFEAAKDVRSWLEEGGMR